MGNQVNGLKAVDRIEVTTIMDNYADVLLPSTDIVKRPPHVIGGAVSGDTLLAEHGLCLLVSAYQGSEKTSILFDAGYSKIGVLHNVEQLGIDLKGIHTMVLSHRHLDHTAGLYALLERLSRPISLVAHPDAFLADRYLKQPDGSIVQFPNILSREKLEDCDVDIIESTDPLLIADDGIGVTGAIERTTSFEKGMPNALVERDGNMEKDPLSDDQALFLHLRDKGLVVIAGCSHSGIINTVLYAMKLSGLNKVHAVLGGFHLSGPAYEPILPDTLSALKHMAPEVIIPMHCTGWSSIHRFAEAFPSAFILNSAGSTYQFIGT